MNCPKCNSVISDNSKFCTYCGAKIENIVSGAPGTGSAMICRNCGAPLKPGAKFCSKCGASQSVQPAQPVQSAPQPAQSMVQPVQSAPQPVQGMAQPVQSAPQPAQSMAQPVQSASQPAQGMTQPEQSMAQPVQGAPQPIQNTAQPIQSSSQPAQGMSQFAQGTSQSQNVSQPTVLLAQSTPQSQYVSQPTVLLAQDTSQTQGTPQAQGASQASGFSQAQGVSPVQPAPQPVPPMPPSTVKPQKPAKKSVFPIVLVAVFVLLIAVTVGGYFVLVNVFDVDPVAMITGNDKNTEDDEDSEESKEEDEDDEDIPSTEVEQLPMVEKKGDPALLDALDAEMEAAQRTFDEMSYWAAFSAGKDLVNQYVTIAEENNLVEEAGEKIRKAYALTSKSAIEFCKVIESQEFGSAAFEQVSVTLNDVIDLASALKEKGYAINSLEIIEYSDGVITRFKEAFIRQINEITEREQWSRDEAWAYAEQAYAVQKDGKAVLFGDDPDDPLRLRYAYCLAWITRKRCENGIADGSMTNEDAFNASVAILSETDYNLLVLQDVISYGRAAKKDVSKYQNAYNAIIDKLKEEQNLSIVNTGVNSATSVDIRKFWYFNDLDGKDEYKVDIYNGTTQATRDWIRDNIPYYIN